MAWLHLIYTTTFSYVKSLLFSEIWSGQEEKDLTGFLKFTYCLNFFLKFAVFDQIQIIGVSGKHFYPLSHLAGLNFPRFRS